MISNVIIMNSPRYHIQSMVIIVNFQSPCGNSTPTANKYAQKKRYFRFSDMCGMHVRQEKQLRENKKKTKFAIYMAHIATNKDIYMYIKYIYWLHLSLSGTPMECIGTQSFKRWHRSRKLARCQTNIVVEHFWHRSHFAGGREKLIKLIYIFVI